MSQIKEKKTNKKHLTTIYHITLNHMQALEAGFQFQSIVIKNIRLDKSIQLRQISSLIFYSAITFAQF